MTFELLDNIPWHSLTGPHARYAAGTATARRYAAGFSPILGFADANRPDFDALAPYCEAGEHFYCNGWPGDVPHGWSIDVDGVAHQYVWHGPMPAPEGPLDAVALQQEHVPEMVALAELTKPGPFAARTRELGAYFGVFASGRLIAMAGERMAAGGLREISGVCTHPDYQGRGLARRLMIKLVRMAMQRGQTSFLHVMDANARARHVYEGMGFAHHQAMPMRVVSRVD
jgi:GNAT superfamily N-acetyltransferase